MHIGFTNLPPELVEAHGDGNLVLFVGAGASIDLPSGLPNFDELTQTILAAVGNDVGAGSGTGGLDEPPDTVLGRLARLGVDVNRNVAEQLDKPGSRPNALHHAIVRLAASGDTVRIVTTNYDRHLTTALADAGAAGSEYRAPALPMGDDFDGLVYLHGSLDQDPRHLVVTDEDFGRAYLRDAWAARFLERMYRKFTVLFVGYSLSDLVMRYLARSLTDETERYIFTHDPDNPDWDVLDITPVGYETDADDRHGDLPLAIDRWAEEASRGLLDHRQRVRELAGAAPTGIPQDDSYLEATLADPQRVKFFTEFAEHQRWLPWAAARTEFGALFNASAIVEPQAIELGRWFVKQFVLDEDRTEVALRALQEAGGRLSPELWSELHLGLRRAGGVEDWMGPWLVLLVEQAPPGAAKWLEYLLSDSDLPDDDHASALLLFEFLTRPTGRVSVPVVGEVRVEVEFPGSARALAKAWTERLASALPGTATRVLSIADRHIRRAHELLVLVNADPAPFDPLSFGLAAIRPHDRFLPREPQDVVIEAARDALEAALAADMPVADGYLHSWIQSPAPLLRRLAIHGVTHHPNMGDCERIDWLLDHDVLFDVSCRPEVFYLLRLVGSATCDDVWPRLLERIEQGPGHDKQDVDDRARYERLEWLRRHGNPPGVADPLHEIQKRHPNWRQGDNPDLGRSAVVTKWGRPAPPLTTEELHALVARDPSEALAAVAPYASNDSPFEGPTWYDVLGLVRETVRAHPEDGIALLKEQDEAELALTEAVVQGWERANLSQTAADLILDRLHELDLTRPDAIAAVTDLLVSSRGPDQSSPDWPRFAKARELAVAAWQAIDTESEPDGTDRWFDHAINAPAGKLARFWMQVVSSDLKAAGDTWQGLSGQIAQPLEEMLDGSGGRAVLAEPVIGSQLALLYHADPNWTSKNALPLLDWTNPARAIRAWNGFLTWGRATKPLLEAGLLDHYLKAAKNASKLRDELQQELAKHLADVALSGSPDSGWLVELTTSADERLRIAWLKWIGRRLRDLPEAEVSAQWKTWMQPYWQQRHKTLPLPLTDMEASAMASWLPALGESIGEAVDLIVDHPAGLDDQLTLSGLARADKLLDSNPGQMARALAHLLSHTNPDDDFYLPCGYVREIVARTKAEASGHDIHKIREEATRLDCKDAAEW